VVGLFVVDILLVVDGLLVVVVVVLVVVVGFLLVVVLVVVVVVLVVVVVVVVVVLLVAVVLGLLNISMAVILATSFSSSLSDCEILAFSDGRNNTFGIRVGGFLLVFEKNLVEVAKGSGVVHTLHGVSVVVITIFGSFALVVTLVGFFVVFLNVLNCFLVFVCTTLPCRLLLNFDFLLTVSPRPV
jgi:hypothetical protein